MRGWLVPPSAPHLHRRHLGIPGSREPAPKFVGSPLVQPPAHPLSTELPCCTYSVRHKSAPPNSWTLRPRVPAALPVISSPHGEFLFINEMLFNPLFSSHQHAADECHGRSTPVKLFLALTAPHWPAPKACRDPSSSTLCLSAPSSGRRPVTLLVCTSKLPTCRG